MATFLVTLNQLSQSTWPVKTIGTLETVVCDVVDAMLLTVYVWAAKRRNETDRDVIPIRLLP